MTHSEIFRIPFRLPLHRFRCFILVWGFEKTYPIYAKMGKIRPLWGISTIDLLKHPINSLGRKTGQFLDKHNLSFLPGYESHDVFHTLLGYGVTAPEEAMLQCCLVGNGKRSPYAFLAMLIGYICLPEYWSQFNFAYNRGADLRPFYHWQFEYLLKENIYDLRAFIMNLPSEPYPLYI